MDKCDPVPKTTHEVHPCSIKGFYIIIYIVHIFSFKITYCYKNLYDIQK